MAANQRLNPTVRTERELNAVAQKQIIYSSPRGVRVGEFTLRRVSRDPLGATILRYVQNWKDGF